MKDYLSESHEGNPQEMADGIQKSLLDLISDTFAHMKAESGLPGLTWEHLEYLVQGLREKKIQVIELDGD